MQAESLRERTFSTESTGFAHLSLNTRMNAVREPPISQTRPLFYNYGDGFTLLFQDGLRMDTLGIDFGCTSIKFGLVTLEDAVTVRHFDQTALGGRRDLDSLTNKVESILDRFPDVTSAGLALPTIVRPEALVDTEIHFNTLWKRIRDRQHFAGKAIVAINDADAAGLAEVVRPAANDLRRGITLVLTLGTGIGSAVFNDGVLLPNTELGVIQLRGIPAERYTAASARTRENLSLQAWASRLQEYFAELEYILSPDAIVLGGGISAEFEQFAPFLHTRARLVPAFYRNQAGVIGAAMAAKNPGNSSFK
jgi:polyphosphate glucokinase